VRADEANQQDLEARLFFETHGDRNMDMTKYSATESKDLKAADFIGKNLKVTIESTSEVHFDATDDKPAQDRAKLHFVGKDKGLVLNPTNTKILIDSYGPNSDDWAGHEIGLSTVDYTDKGFGHGWLVKPLDVAEPDFEDEIPF
jgi:hypothetical protein|tara:strand:- start:34 stop:465 length:432 start_codon:yes stop_codon:yes gene_type:complete